MALTVTGATGAIDHSAGDVLVAFVASAATTGAGWTQFARYTTTWSYDTLTAAYCVATGGSSFSTLGWTPYYSYRITGADQTSPVAGTNSGQGAAWSAPAQFTIGAVTVPTDGVRLTFFGGYGGGGNPPFSGGVTASSGTVDWYQSYRATVQGTNSGTFTVTGPNLSGGNLAWATIAIAPAPSVTSGFFSMF